MGQFFGSIYCLFEDLFGLDLANYLWGISSPESQTNAFIGIGLTMFAISLFFVVLYYYMLNIPSLCVWWAWAIFGAVNVIVNFFVGWQWVLNDYYDGKMVTIDPATNLKTPLNIGESEILCFGVSNMLLSLLAFFLFSLALKWWSRNCSHSPF